MFDVWRVKNTKIHVGIDTKSIKDQNIQLYAYAKRKISHIYLCLTDALQVLTWYLSEQKWRLKVCVGVFFLTSCCNIFLEEETDCDSKAKRSECRWEFQGIPSNVWRENFGCMNPLPPFANVKEGLPAPRVWIERKWIWSKQNIFLRLDNFDIIPSLNIEPMPQV